MNGYTGKILWVDLTSKVSEILELSEDILRKFLVGKGLGAYLLYKNLKPKTDPYSPQNLLIFVTGPLSGTSFSCVTHGGVVTKSPLTETFLDSYAGGIFAHTIKNAGGLDSLLKE